MSDNNLYILFPSRSEFVKYSDEELIAVIRSLHHTLFLIDHEKYDGYYSNNAFNNFYNFIQSRDEDLSKMLLQTLNDWLPLNNLNEENGDLIYISGREGVQAMVCEEDNLPNYSAIISLGVIDHTNAIKRIHNTAPSFIETIPCTEIAVYQWFCTNRYPQRQFRSEYNKHSSFGERTGKKGHVVSCFTYSETEADKYLKLAIGTASDKRFVYHKSDDHFLIIFFCQDHEGETFHAFQTGDENKAEIQKLGNHAIKKLKLLKKLGIHH